MKATSLSAGQTWETIIFKLAVFLMLVPSIIFGSSDWSHTATAVLDEAANELGLEFSGLGALGAIKDPTAMVTVLVRRDESFLYSVGSTDPGIEYMGLSAVEGVEFGFRAEDITDVAPYTVALDCNDFANFSEGFDVRYRFTLGQEKSPWFITSATLVPGSGDTTSPAVPLGLAAFPANSQIAVTWDDSPEGDWASYDVYRSVAGGIFSNVATGLVVSSYGDTGLTNGVLYAYKVTATDTDGNESGQTDQVSATPVK